MRYVFVLVGLVLGVILVRAFLLDPTEELALRLFIDGGQEKPPFTVRDVLTSTTFAKCMAGAAVGGLSGAFLYPGKSRKKSGKSSKK